MYKASGLLLASIAAVVLLAPPAGSQTRKATLDTVTVDLLNLQNVVSEMQRSSDTRNAETKALLQQVLTRFGTIDSSVQKLAESLATIKAGDEASAKSLQDARADLTKIKASLDTLNQLNIGESLSNMSSQLTALKKQINDLPTTPAAAGPSAADLWNEAVAYQSGNFPEFAISSFKEFLSNYPMDFRAPMAQISIGNNHMAMKNYEASVIDYDEAIQKYPDSDKKCNALYKKGLALDQLKKISEADKIYRSVVKDCANTVEGPLAADQLKRPTARLKGQ